MCLIGCPNLLFLDEPTTGVDPVSRRYLEKILKKMNGSSMLLSTHHMGEAEALCDNLAIMRNGQFVCYGTANELKKNYSKGYKCTIRH